MAYIVKDLWRLSSISDDKILDEKINIGKIVPISTVDWHGRSVCTIFFNGCPFKCPYCQNYKLLECKKSMSVKDVELKITDSSPFISAVVFSGGEPTMHYRELIYLAKYIKYKNLKVGLQTNGYYPEIISELIYKKLVDKIFLDIKADLFSYERYDEFTGGYGDEKGKLKVNKILNTFELLKDKDEVRTTIFPAFNDSIKILRYLCEKKFEGDYVIQQGLPWNTLNKKIKSEGILNIHDMREIWFELDQIKNNYKSNMIIKIRTRDNGEENISLRNAGNIKGKTV
jgi:pyruvate formate lyase activating enzyme